MQDMIIFQPENVVYMNKEKETVMESAQAAGVFVENICGGNGTCGKCKVKAVIGDFNPLMEEEKNCLTEEEIKEGYRLACKLVPKMAFKTCEIEVPEEVLESDETLLEKKDSFGEKESREKAEQEKLRFFQNFADSFMKNKGAKQEILAGEEGILQKDTEKNVGEQSYGIAVDIGTTNIEAVLWDLSQCKCIGRTIRLNEQRRYGADVVSRIAFSMQSEEHFKQACELLNRQVSEMVLELSDNIENKTDAIGKIVVVANAAMMHFLAKERPDSLAKAPYKTNYKEAKILDGTQFGAKNAKVVLMPNIEGFVGADTAGVIAYFLDYKELENTITIDIGTNGEMIVVKNRKMYVASTAAGPAFEGASISCGMRAEQGAVQGMTIGETLSFKVVGDGAPKGICGSGLIEIVADLYTIGAIDETGYLLDRKAALEHGCPKIVAERLEADENGNEFILYKDASKKVSLTQKDIRELQLAKAAILAGGKTMLNACGIAESDVKTCYLAGAFGTYLNADAAKKIGLLPDIPGERIQAVGNAALLGACKVLLSGEYLEKLKQVVKKAEHISLSEEDGFKELYVKEMMFPHKL